MSDTPLIQQIIEQDLINNKYVEPEKAQYKISGKKKKKLKKLRKEGNEKLAKEVALKFVEASRYPLDISSISTCQIKSFEGRYRYEGRSQAMGFSIPSDIPGSKVLSIDRLRFALSNVQSAISRVTKLDAIFNFNHKDAVSWSLAPYYEQILAEIESLPRIILTEFFENHDTRVDQKKVFTQKEGPFVIKKAVVTPDKTGTCEEGLHVTTLGGCYNYFGQNTSFRLWETKFTLDDIAGFDGEKIRLKSGTCKEIDWPFFVSNKKPPHDGNPSFLSKIVPSILKSKTSKIRAKQKPHKKGIKNDKKKD